MTNKAELDRILFPILSNEDIWTDGNRLTRETFELGRRLFLEGYHKEEIYQILSELYKRREYMMNDYIKRTGHGYNL